MQQIITFRSTNDPRDMRVFITSNPSWTPARIAQVRENARRQGTFTVEVKPHTPILGPLPIGDAACPTCAQNLVGDRPYAIHHYHNNGLPDFNPRMKGYAV